MAFCRLDVIRQPVRVQIQAAGLLATLLAVGGVDRRKDEGEFAQCMSKGQTFITSVNALGRQVSIWTFPAFSLCAPNGAHTSSIGMRGRGPGSPICRVARAEFQRL